MMESKPVTFGFLVVVIALIISLSGCIQQEESVDYSAIREYEGEKLSAITDFRENSIEGPQHIDKERYVLNITGLVDNPQNYTYDEIINDYHQYKKVVRLLRRGMECNNSVGRCISQRFDRGSKRLIKRNSNHIPCV